MPRKALGRGLSAILISPGAADVRPGERVELLDVADIHLNPYQPRSHIDAEALESLAHSIAKQGVIQPIVVRPREEGGYWLVAGERRLRATKNARIARVPAVVRDLNDRESLAIALVENLQREDLNAIDEARSVARLIGEFNLTHQDAADALGRSRAAVSNALRLLDLNDAVRTMVVERRLEMGHARALLALKPEEQGGYAQQILDGRLTVRESEQLVRRAAKPRPERRSRSPAQDLRVPERWRHRIVIVQTRKGANIRLTSLAEDELEALLDWLRQRDAL